MTPEHLKEMRGRAENDFKIIRYALSKANVFNNHDGEKIMTKTKALCAVEDLKTKILLAYEKD